jgi:deoxyribose-phosphate aldolase
MRCYFVVFFLEHDLMNSRVNTSPDLERLVEIVSSEVYRRLENLRQPATCDPSGCELTDCKAKTGDCTGCGGCVSKKPRTVERMLNEGAVRFSSSQGQSPPVHGTLASMIDHTLLKPDASHEQIKKLCEEAAQYKFATVCVNSTNVGLAAQLLQGTGVKAIAVVGFPLGASTPRAKAFETLEAIRAGAQEIDMVINIGALKSKDYKLVFDDIRGVVEAAGAVPVKVILETSNLNADEKIIACGLSKAAGAAFVKTSTGFGGGGATVEDIKLMRRIVGADIGVKASGGVRTLEDAQKFIEAGANRLGASASVEIVTGKKADGKGY